MKYVTLIPLLFFAFNVEAAYWVVDKNAPARGSIKDISDSSVVSLDSYLYAKIPDEILLAKDSKSCKVKYDKTLKALIAYDIENKELLSSEKTILGREKVITRETKNIENCLKKEGISDKKKSKKSTEYDDLEFRVSVLEKQIKQIISALQSMGKLTTLKG